MLINLTELFSVDGKEKDYTCGIDMNQLCTSKDAYDIVILGTKSFFSPAMQW